MNDFFAEFMTCISFAIGILLAGGSLYMIYNIIF